MNDPDIRRKLQKLSAIGSAALPERERERYNQLDNDMLKIYSTAKVPGYENRTETKTLEPEITLIMAESRFGGIKKKLPCRRLDLFDIFFKYLITGTPKNWSTTGCSGARRRGGR